MPKQKSKINEGKYILTGLCYLLLLPLIGGGMLTCGAGIYLADTEFPISSKNILTAGCMIIGFGVLAGIIFLINSQSVICRLCRAQFFKRLKCTRKSNVPNIAGNVRVPLALSMITKRSSIRCPYCGEKHVYFPKSK